MRPETPSTEEQRLMLKEDTMAMRYKQHLRVVISGDQGDAILGAGHIMSGTEVGGSNARLKNTRLEPSLNSASSCKDKGDRSSNAPGAN